MTYYYIDRPFLFPDANSIEELWAYAEEKAEQIVMKEAIIDHIPKEKRVKRFVIKRDDIVIEEIKERILEARKMFDELIKTI